MMRGNGKEGRTRTPVANLSERGGMDRVLGKKGEERR
jgi:hypothetical protein